MTPSLKLARFVLYQKICHHIQQRAARLCHSGLVVAGGGDETGTRKSDIPIKPSCKLSGADQKEEEMLLRRSSHTRGSFTQLRTLWSPTISPSLTHLPETSLNAQASQFRTLFTHRASPFRNGHSSIPLFISTDKCYRGFHTTSFVRSIDSKTTREPATEESRSSTTRHLFRFLKETAEAGDKEAQFKVGCMLCLGEAAMRASLGLSEADADADEESAALIQLEQLDYILGDDGVVIPKDRDAFESTKIANWKQWLKREREKLKNRNSAQQDTSEKEDTIALDYTEAAKWFAHSAQQNHPFAQYFVSVNLPSS